MQRPAGPAHTVLMDLSDALAFIGNHDRTVLTTRRKDGRPQMSPVNSGVIDGVVCISSRAPLAKVHNIRRDPEVSMLLFTKAFFDHGCRSTAGPRSSTSRRRWTCWSPYTARLRVSILTGTSTDGR